MTDWLILAAGFAVALPVGLSSIGGFLLAPLLVALGAFDLRHAIAAALAAFIPGVLVAVWLHARREGIDLRLAGWLGVSSLAGAPIGVALNMHLPEQAVRVLLAAALLVLAWRSVRSGRTDKEETTNARRRTVWATCFGLCAGISAGLVGIGGSAVMVPGLLALGVSPAKAITTGMAASLLGSAAAVATYWPYVRVDPGLLGALTVSVGAGLLLGAWASRRVAVARLASGVAVMAVFGAVWLLV